MKKVFIDTNVILDYVLRREHGAEAMAVIAWLIQNKVQMMMSTGGFYTLHFIIDKYLRKELGLDKPSRISPLRKLLKTILRTFTVAKHDNATLLQGVDDMNFTDIEDSCQYQLAAASGCEVLITLNLNDFKKSMEGNLPILSPQQFIDLYIGS